MNYVIQRLQVLAVLVNLKPGNYLRYLMKITKHTQSLKQQKTNQCKIKL